MSKNIDIDNDYRRAVFILKNNIKSVSDLLKIWSYSGPCSGDCPSIEKIRKKVEKFLDFF